MSIKQDILDQLDGLIQEGNRLNASYRMVEMGQMESELPESDFRSFSTTTLAAIERIAGRNSEYYRSLPPADPNDPFTLPGYNNTKIPAMIGSLVALRQAVDKGFLISLESKLRANIHDDFLQQAKGSKIRRIGAMIGSPSDASEERQEITNAIIRWNAVNREKGIIIDPVKWETHATPGLQGRPQGMINEELIPISDILVAVFRSRAGSPTGKELSGTIEEIREFMRIGKYIVLYFYDGEVDIGKVDPDQIKTINEFKKEIQQHGLTASYNN
ncbi:MAG: hypothetical protein IT426_11220 [Pirellulales bacterium]|nr:hypothetical protein [Pirellulales bacterium]